MPRAAALLLAAALAGCGVEANSHGMQDMPGGKHMPAPDPVTVVETAPVTTGSVADVLATSATVESESAADIIPMSTGIVVSVHKDEGDPVRRGDLLAVLDNVTLDASAERAATELRRLEEQYREMERLAAQGAVSQRELSDLRYQLDSARTSMREASRSRGQTRLTAPFDGVVAARNVRVGELASGSAPAFQVVDPEHLRVVAQMPERDLPRVRVGQPATLTSAYDPELTATGHVARIAPVVDAASGTFRVTVEVDPGQTSLRPGQYVTVDLEVDRRDGVVVVPRKAVVYEDGAPVVYVYDDPTEEELAERDRGEAEGGGDEAAEDRSWFAALFDKGDEGDEGDRAEGGEAEAPDAEGPVKIARRVPVQLGLLDHEVAQVLDGVAPGQRVITVGQSHLRNLARVVDAAERAAEAEGGPEDDGEQG